jgi:hypothetical protein
VKASGWILTKDHDLQIKVEEQGMDVIPVQELHQRFQGIVVAMAQEFPPVMAGTAGQLFTVYIAKRGTKEGQGAGRGI